MNELDVVREAVDSRDSETYLRELLDQLCLHRPQHSVGLELVKLAETQSEEICLDRALECARAALRLLDPARSPEEVARMSQLIGLFDDLYALPPLCHQERRLLFLEIRTVLRREQWPTSASLTFLDILGELEDYNRWALSSVAENLRNSPAYYARRKEWIDDMARSAEQGEQLSPPKRSSLLQRIKGWWARYFD